MANCCQGRFDCPGIKARIGGKNEMDIRENLMLIGEETKNELAQITASSELDALKVKV